MVSANHTNGTIQRKDLKFYLRKHFYRNILLEVQFQQAAINHFEP